MMALGWKKWALGCIMGGWLWGIPAQAAETVSVTLPDFAVTLNGIAFDSSTSRYPLLVYQNTTYFPMTYHGSRALGLETQWTEEAGGCFKLEATGIAGAALDAYQQDSRNGKTQTAQTVDFALEVNGETVDPRQEDYPLLSFRGVTYFPLTWHYAAECFGWDYAFDTQTGLTIQANDWKQVSLPQDRARDSEGAFRSGVIVSNGYVYYEATGDESNSCRYRRPSK